MGTLAAKAREAIARCLADVEDHPQPEHYAQADDVLLAIRNAGVRLLGPADESEDRWYHTGPCQPGCTCGLVNVFQDRC